MESRPEGDRLRTSLDALGRVLLPDEWHANQSPEAVLQHEGLRAKLKKLMDGERVVGLDESHSKALSRLSRAPT